MSTPTPSAPAGDPAAPAATDPAAGDPTTGQVPATPPANDPAPKPTPPANEPDTAKPGEDPAATIARLQNQLAAARKDAGSQRVTAKHRAADEARQDLAKQVLAIIDPDSADKPATPEQLVEQLTAQQAKTRAAEMRLAVYHAAPDAGADPRALDDSRQFADAVAEIDPTDAEAVKAAITAAVEANPRLAAQQPAPQAPAVPARGGGEMGGNAPEVTPERFAAMDYQQRAELYRSDPDTYRRLVGS